MESRTMRRPRWVLGWILVTLVGFALGSTLVFIGGWSAVEAATGDADRILDGGIGFFLYLTAAFTVGGTVLAAGQWLLLRRRVPAAAGRWILGGAAGFAVVAIGYFALYERVPELVSEVVHNLLGGAAMGLIQVPVVRRLTGRSRGWVLVTALAMLLAGLTASLVRVLGGTDDLAGPLGVAAAALVTGTVISGWITTAQPAPASTTTRSEHVAV